MTAAIAAAPDLVLSQAQRDHFDLFGFLRLRGAIADRMAEITEEFERLWAERSGGHNGQAHDGQRRSCIYPFIDQSPILSSLLDDPRIHGLAVSLLGEDFNYIGSDGNLYAGDTGWHSDGGHRGPRYIKIPIYLDRLDGRNGCLRVVPGSHRIGEPYADVAQRSVRAHGESLGVGLADVPAATLETEPGDLLVFNHNLLHAAAGGGHRRRMFTLNLCQHHGEEELPELQSYLGSHARFLIERNVGPAMLAHASPRRMRHLRQVMENDFLIAEKLAAERGARAEPSRG
jgi:hypothetical protein